MFLSHASSRSSSLSSWDKSCWSSTTEIKDPYEGHLLKWHHRPLTASRLHSSDIIWFLVIGFHWGNSLDSSIPSPKPVVQVKCVAADWALAPFCLAKCARHSTKKKAEQAVVPLTSCLQWAQHNNRKSVLPVCFLGLTTESLSLTLFCIDTHRTTAGKRKAGRCLLHMLHRGGHGSHSQTQGWKEGIVTTQKTNRHLYIHHLITRAAWDV